MKEIEIIIEVFGIGILGFIMGYFTAKLWK